MIAISHTIRIQKVDVEEGLRMLKKAEINLGYNLKKKKAYFSKTKPYRRSLTASRLLQQSLSCSRSRKPRRSHSLLLSSSAPSSPRSFSSYRKDRTCYHCKQLEHFLSDCPHKDLMVRLLADYLKKSPSRSLLKGSRKQNLRSSY